MDIALIEAYKLFWIIPPLLQDAVHGEAREGLAPKYNVPMPTTSH